MTIETTSIKSVALGNGATTVWPYTFLIPDSADLVLTTVDVASGNETIIPPVNYTVSGIGNPAGGSVTYPLSGSPLSNAFYLVIERQLPLTQETDLLNQGATYPEAIEDALDFLTMITQQLQDQINRSIVFSVADTTEQTLPTATARANKQLGFDANGDPIAIAALDPSVTVSAAMIPVVTAPSTAAALTALGLPGALLDLLIPAGTIWDYSLTSAPTGFALAFGQPATGSWPVLRAALVAAGSPFGTNGVDPLLPDGRSRSFTGKSDMGGVDNGLWSGGNILGAVSGSQVVTLALASIPTGITCSGNNSITVSSANAGGTGSDIIRANQVPTQAVQAAGTGFAWLTTDTILRSAIVSTNTAQAIAVTSNNTGGGSHENRHPSLILNKIIKVH